LTLVTDELVGVPLEALPDNVYGFTFSPLNENTPLFAKRVFQCFEIHRLADGEVEILGFLTPKEAQALREGREELDVKLYPEPRDESTELVTVQLHRIIRAKPPVRSDGNYMPVHVDAIENRN
jgi:hypothetical protein